MGVELEIDLQVLKSEIKKTYASVSEEPEKDFIFPTGYRTFDEEQVVLNGKASTCGAFAEPSDGLEPSTPSLPSRSRGNWSQPVATVLA